MDTILKIPGGILGYEQTHKQLAYAEASQEMPAEQAEFLPVGERIQALRRDGTYSSAGPFVFVTDTPRGVDLLVAAIEAVVSAVSSDELRIIVEATDFIGMSHNRLSNDKLVGGYAVERFRTGGAHSVVLIDESAVLRMSHTGLCNLAAHEMRHVWQSATNFYGSTEFQRTVREVAETQVVERDAESFAESLGFYRDSSMNARALGYPEDADFATIQKNWRLLPDEQKSNIAEFCAIQGADWRELGSGICVDRRLFDVASAWPELPDSERAKVAQFVRAVWQKQLQAG